MNPPTEAVERVARADDRGPEWAEMEARHAVEGVTKWHVTRTPGATDEQVAKAMNELAREMAIPEKRVAGRLRGEAFLWRDSAMCALNRVRVTEGRFLPVKLTPRERATAERDQQLAALLIEAATLLDQSATAALHAMQPAIDAAVLVDAFLAGCNEMYDAWVAGDGQREADFTEAANDYAEQVSIKAGGWQPIETEPAYEAAFRDGFRACVARPLRTMDDDPQAGGGMRGSPRGDAYHAACNAVSDAIRKVPT